MKLNNAGSLEESYDKSTQCIKKQRHYFANEKIRMAKAMCFSSSHIQMWELDQKEGWMPKNWCFPTAALEKTLESPLDCKEIKLVNPKGDQPWIFIGRTEAEAPILWSLMWRANTLEKTWCWERLRAGREGGNRLRDGWMASPTQRTWVWANCGRWWSTGKPSGL